jgi:tetratricopeptide (TPR) repeat protein
MSVARRQLARELLEKAYNLQSEGEFDLAADLYRQSIKAHPTAEAYTFLGWTYHFLGKTDEAIAECKNAIRVDPTFGNPYNDIGAYLIELNRHDEAIPWLEQAIASERYDSYHFAWYNLGRAYVAKEMYNRARECFRKSLQIEPRHTPAAEALKKLSTLVQ